jgi:predicted XRE-type DNA-binding protein
VNKKYLALLDEGWEHSTSALADLGLEDADRLQAKAYLRAAILSHIAALRITQREAARRVGLPQPKMSNLMSDTASHGFSSDKLMDVAMKLGLDVKIQVIPSRAEVGHVIVPGATRRKSSRAEANPRKVAKPTRLAKVKPARAAKVA